MAAVVMDGRSWGHTTTCGPGLYVVCRNMLYSSTGCMMGDYMNKMYAGAVGPASSASRGGFGSGPWSAA